MKNTARSATALAVAALSAAAMTGCSTGTSANDSSSLSIGIITPLHSFSAAEALWSHEAPLLQAVYDTLLQAEPDGTIGGGLASDFSWDENRTVLTLELVDGVTFTDGSDFTAEVAVANLERFKNGTSPNASYLAAMESAAAIDADTVQVTLNAPDPAFTTYLSQNAGLQQSAESFDSADAQTVPVGSGPYVLDTAATVEGSTYTFTAREGYWQPEHQLYETIEMKIYDNQTSVLNAVRDGQVDATPLFDTTSDDLVEAAGFSLSPQLSETWNGLILADRNGDMNDALGDVRVRQAINMAFDRESLLQAMANGQGSATTQIFPPSSPGYDEGLDELYPYDVDGARELLAEAGYPDGFTLSMPTTTALPAATYALISQPLADIGITVQETSLPITQLLSDVVAPTYPAFYFQLQEDPTDWQIAQFALTESATWNPFNATDPEIKSYLDTVQTGDTAAAASASAELNRYVVENAWFAPFYRPLFNYASGPNVDIQMQVGGAAPSIWNFTPAASE